MTDTPDHRHRHRRLTGPMRDALKRARDQGLPVEAPRVHRRTLKALRDHELIEQRRNRRGKPMWRASALGLLALFEDAPASFLHIRSQYGYTTRLDCAMFGEPEALRDPGDESERCWWHGLAA